MTARVKIYGAGSIGNHLAHACRSRNWRVTMCDTDEEALKRTREDIYPARYGEWDDGIALAKPEDVSGRAFDLVIIGTPPESHIALASLELDKGGDAPRVILIEKPLCGPDMAGCAELWRKARDAGSTVCVGYNHALTANTGYAERLLREEDLGGPRTLTVEWVEHWGGIFAAHPWLDGPSDSYLGRADLGGGACGEHSHGINIWQHFSHLVGAGRIVEVASVMDRVVGGGVDYDRIAQLSVTTETGLVGYIVQDVVTRPPRKRLRVQGERGALVWEVNRAPDNDAVSWWTDGSQWREELMPKTRPEDFAGEIRHAGALLENPDAPSPISLERGLETMMVVAAAHRSAAEGRTVHIDYSSGYSTDSIR